MYGQKKKKKRSFQYSTVVAMVQFYAGVTKGQGHGDENTSGEGCVVSTEILDAENGGGVGQGISMLKGT